MATRLNNTNSGVYRDIRPHNITTQITQKLPEKVLSNEPVRRNGFILYNIEDKCLYYSIGTQWIGLQQKEEGGAIATNKLEPTEDSNVLAVRKPVFFERPAIGRIQIANSIIVPTSANVILADWDILWETTPLSTGSIFDIGSGSILRQDLLTDYFQNECIENPCVYIERHVSLELNWQNPISGTDRYVILVFRSKSEDFIEFSRHVLHLNEDSLNQGTTIEHHDIVKCCANDSGDPSELIFSFINSSGQDIEIFPIQSYATFTLLAVENGDPP